MEDRKSVSERQAIGDREARTHTRSLEHDNRRRGRTALTGATNKVGTRLPCSSHLLGIASPQYYSNLDCRARQCVSWVVANLYNVK